MAIVRAIVEQIKIPSFNGTGYVCLNKLGDQRSCVRMKNEGMKILK